MPYWVSESCRSGISSGKPSTTMTPSTAVKEIEEATSSVLAPIAGATAAIAELPQIELPQAIRIESRTGRPSDRLMPKETASERITSATTETSRAKPEAPTAAKVSEAPSSATATSSNCLALKAIPARQRRPGSQNVRMAVPSRMAITMAST